MILQTVDASFGELFTTVLAGMLVSVGVIFELWTTVEVLKNERVRFAAHLELITRDFSPEGEIDVFRAPQVQGVSG